MLRRLPNDSSATLGMMQMKRTIFGAIVVVAILAAAIGGFAMWRQHSSSAHSRPVTNFLIENAATPGKSSSDFAQEQLAVDTTARIVFQYNPQLMTAVSVRFVGSNGTTVKATDPSKLDASGNCNLTIDTTGMPADIYRVELLNQDQKVVDFGELTLTPTAK